MSGFIEAETLKEGVYQFLKCITSDIERANKAVKNLKITITVIDLSDEEEKEITLYVDNKAFK